MFDSSLKLYFYKFFFGDNCLIKGFANIPVLDLYLWSNAKIANNVFVKEVINSSQKFSKAVNILSYNETITKPLLLKCNKLLRPKDKTYDIRTKEMCAGDPKTNPYTFYCLPFECIDELFDEMIELINSETELTTNIALIGIMQFIFIHPFKDGNGRTSRALFLAMMQPEYGLTTSCLFMLYLKNINRMGYYSAMHDYRNGDTDSLKKFYLKTINWVNDSTEVLNVLFDDYACKIDDVNLDQESEYTQVVVLLPVKSAKKLDKSIFEFHSKKGKNNVFINNALLSVINQFDYYLRSELRKHNAL